MSVNSMFLWGGILMNVMTLSFCQVYCTDTQKFTLVNLNRMINRFASRQWFFCNVFRNSIPDHLTPWASIDTNRLLNNMNLKVYTCTVILNINGRKDYEIFLIFVGKIIYILFFYNRWLSAGICERVWKVCTDVFRKIKEKYSCYGGFIPSNHIRVWC